MGKHTLEELQRRSKIAAQKQELVEIAAKNLPSPAYDAADAAGHSDYVCHSVRCLSIIRRDYGESFFRKHVADVQEERARQLASYEEGQEAVWSFDHLAHGVEHVSDSIDTLEHIFSTNELVQAIKRLKPEQNPKILLSLLRESADRLERVIKSVGLL
jgi:hypothetical protein